MADNVTPIKAAEAELTPPISETTRRLERVQVQAGGRRGRG